MSKEVKKAESKLILPLKYRGMFLSIFSGTYTLSIHNELKKYFEDTAKMFEKVATDTAGMMNIFTKQKKINKRGVIKEEHKEEVNKYLEEVYYSEVELEFPVSLLKKVLKVKESRYKDIMDNEVVISKSEFITQVDNKALENEINVLKEIIKINK